MIIESNVASFLNLSLWLIKTELIDPDDLLIEISNMCVEKFH